eukprot:CAMPEP_0202900880 /NCGR_PEP_ID=MMETSP1392-20130828/12087_1 /ASSEMBLY_ACC=CAM_ASM_000868 /TAXON_ID=225041 /ORGANISM="Chlamydomonas chlamydogama, Strain SAG 11-48b" /LENGTH=107 /DNA_ID=CAMNT_0049587337 /DNA_START=95 /DNA_END=415 /DNA_ORIENTATION=+
MSTNNKIVPFSEDDEVPDEQRVKRPDAPASSVQASQSQPASQWLVPQPGKWTTGLFECLPPPPEEGGVVYASACPPMLFGELSHQLNGSNSTLACLLYGFTWPYAAW